MEELARRLRAKINTVRQSVEDVELELIRCLIYARRDLYRREKRVSFLFYYAQAHYAINIGMICVCLPKKSDRREICFFLLSHFNDAFRIHTTHTHTRVAEIQHVDDVIYWSR